MTQLNYYRISFKDFPNQEVLDRMPEEMAVLMSRQPAVESMKKISKSTFYRIQREDAKAFWSGLEPALFGTKESVVA
jgi:hypothetical protein